MRSAIPKSAGRRLTKPSLRRDLDPCARRGCRRTRSQHRPDGGVFCCGPCRLRPHFKAHKTPEIAKRQLAAGSCTGLTCATVGEAEIAAAFCDDVLIANEVVSPAKCARGSIGPPDSRDDGNRFAGGARGAVAGARAAGSRVGVLVDLNVGQGRCGVEPGEAVLTLARQAAQSDGITLRGVMGYEGHLQPVRDRAERESRAQSALHALVTAATTADGVEPAVRGRVGRWHGDVRHQRADRRYHRDSGRIVCTDGHRLRRGGRSVRAGLLGAWHRGQPPARDRCVADCGHKSMTKDHGLPSVRGMEGATVTSLNDEHATIALPPDSTVRVGDRVELFPSTSIPRSTSTTSSMSSKGNEVVDMWPIAARGILSIEWLDSGTGVSSSCLLEVFMTNASFDRCLLGMALIASFVGEPLRAQGGDKHPVSAEQYQRWKTELSNWGRWGKDDQIGALNLITRPSGVRPRRW